jgi:hypothetical protein
VRIQHVSGPAFGAQLQVHADNKWGEAVKSSASPPANSNLKANQIFACYIDVKVVEVAGRRSYAFDIVMTE